MNFSSEEIKQVIDYHRYQETINDAQDCPEAAKRHGDRAKELETVLAADSL
jgi:hypothetical protein